MRIVICDDDQAYVNMISINVHNYFNSHHIRHDIYSFTDCSELFNQNIKYDMAFLDIEMKPVNGMEIARKLKELKSRIIIFMITSHNQYLDDAMDLHVFRFIQKPLDIERLFSGLDHALDLLQHTTIPFYLSEEGKTVRIFSDDIIYIEIVKRHTQVVTAKKTYLSDNSIAYWYSHLPKTTFYLVHSSYIVNVGYITVYSRDLVTLGNYQIPIAYRKQTSFKKFFSEYCNA